MHPIRYFNSQTGQVETEKVYGAGAVHFLYGTRLGRWIERLIAANGLFSSFYGWLQNLPFSRRKIAPFIKEMGIALSDFEVPTGGYPNFNSFFIRKWQPGKRPFEDLPTVLPAFAEARYLGWERISPDQTFPVKGRDLSARSLLGNAPQAAEWVERFAGGPLLLARLCPIDYHRYHYPVAGKTVTHWSLRGHYHSVNPWALRSLGTVFSKNVRRVEILDTPEFGYMAMVEVGATGVGRIVQTHDSARPFGRGDEKGYFLFGGSTVILLGQAGRWKPNSLIIENTTQSREVWVPLGRSLGERDQ